MQGMVLHRLDFYSLDRTGTGQGEKVIMQFQAAMSTATPAAARLTIAIPNLHMKKQCQKGVSVPSSTDQ